jgi:putative endonuclease
MTTDRAHVYILANGYKRFYTGVTSRLVSRIREHKTRLDPNCFTARDNIDQLVWYEEHLSIVEAIAREKQIKGWLRIKKIQLIVGVNPIWKDLSVELLRMPEFDEAKMRAPETF